MKRSLRKAGFTLLEVLMVVAMLAIVGGAIITSYGGLEDKAAKGTATHSIAAITEAFLCALYPQPTSKILWSLFIDIWL